MGSVASLGLLWSAWDKWLNLDFNEAVGFVTGLWCVALVARNNIWNFPVGLVNSVFLGIVFRHSRLFNDMSLQIVYFALGVHGWYLWLWGGTQLTQLPISRAGTRQLIICGLGVIAATPFLMAFSRWVGGASPLLDALTTALSLAAQWLLNTKKIENWWFWIVVDVIYIPLYLSRGLPLTAMLYACFLGLCVAGLLAWRRTMVQESVAGAA